MGNIPGLINTSLFREVYGFKDEPKLFSLLKALAEGSISRKDFNKALSDAKPKNQDKARDEIEMLKTENERLTKKCERLEDENRQLKLKLQAQQQDEYTFSDASPKPCSSGRIERTPLFAYGRRPKRPKFTLPEFDNNSSEEEERCSFSPAYESSLRDTEESDTEKDFLNENVIPGTPTAKTSGIVSTIIKKCEGLTGKLKEKKVETQSAPAPAATVRSNRRLSEVFNKGDHVEALWQDRNPELRKFYKASIVAVVSSGLYKVRFLDDGQYRFVSKKDLRRA